MGSDFDKLSEAEHTNSEGHEGVKAIVDTFTDRMGDEDGVSSKILTVPNIISFCRLLLIPIFLILLLKGHDVAAALVFAFAALSDCIDGFIARKTHAVSKLGQILDPFVDRLLMASGAIGLIVVGRLPIWMVVLVLLRDAVLLVGGTWLLKEKGIRVPVIFAGKVATTFLFSGFAFLLINWPIVNGLGVTTAAWLPGFTAATCSVGIWFVYAGLLLGIFTTSYYVIKSAKALHQVNMQLKSM